MVRNLLAGIAAIAICANFTIEPSRAADRPTVGIVAAFSGAYAQWGEAYKREIDLYMVQHDGKNGNPKINLILRDTPGTDYARTKQVVQEFITRDNAVVVGGGEFTPEALAVAPLVTEAKIPYVIFNGATSFIVDKSPYLVRVGFTIWQPNVPLADYAVSHGCKKATLVVADYAPGQDTVDALTYGFQKGGGKIAAVVKVPLGTTDFSAYMQRLKDSEPQCVVPFMPGGPMSLTFLKDFAQGGFAQHGVVLYDAGGITAENQLDAVGDAALGVISSGVYSTYLNNPMNHAFINALAKKYPNIRRQFVPVDGYDGMEVIYHMLRATHGKRDGDKAIASIIGYHWMSPRGPVSIDKYRDIVEPVYMRKCVKENGVTFNKEFKTYPDVHDQWHELHHPAS
ncbi:MAG TPA: ABC transporter substrate-binding protein [Stellaceae bacterium]|nr:ABC transporter substrate-binding protein [Stellaceae bacterium]